MGVHWMKIKDSPPTPPLRGIRAKPTGKLSIADDRTAIEWLFAFSVVIPLAAMALAWLF